MTTAVEAGEGSASRSGLSLPRERPGIYCTGGWMGPTAVLDRCGKIRPPTGIRTPARSAPNQSLYRLSYRAHCKYGNESKISFTSHPRRDKPVSSSDNQKTNCIYIYIYIYICVCVIFFISCSKLMHPLFIIFFHIPLHVSSNIVLIIRRIHCIHTASGSLYVTLLR